MREFDIYKIFVQYRGQMKPYGPVLSRKYTITHSDITAELFLFVDEVFAKDKITNMRDEVRIMWKNTEEGLVLIGSVLVDGKGVEGDPSIRNKIFYNEMPKALQALRQGDKFLFEKYYNLDKTPVFIRFKSTEPKYDKVYDFGLIGDYKME